LLLLKMLDGTAATAPLLLWICREEALELQGEEAAGCRHPLLLLLHPAAAGEL
jgi:hypothetical protein